MLLSDNSQRLKTAILFMMATIIMEVVGLITAALGLKVIMDLEGGLEESLLITYFDMAEQLFAIVYMLVFIGTIITFILWFRRAYYNVWQFARNSPRFTEGWAAGSWFVPILSLFRPVQIMREIWLKTIAFLRSYSPIVPPTNMQATISLWWGTWIAGSLIGNASGKISLKSDTLEAFRIAYIFDFISSVCLLVSAIVLLKIMKKYGELENELTMIGEGASEDSIFYKTPDTIQEDF